MKYIFLSFLLISTGFANSLPVDFESKTPNSPILLNDFAQNFKHLNEKICVKKTLGVGEAVSVAASIPAFTISGLENNVYYSLDVQLNYSYPTGATDLSYREMALEFSQNGTVIDYFVQRYHASWASTRDRFYIPYFKSSGNGSFTVEASEISGLNLNTGTTIYLCKLNYVVKEQSSFTSP